MADLTLLEDLVNHALRREHVKTALICLVSTEWLLSLYHFLCHDFGRHTQYIHRIYKGRCCHLI